MKYYISRFWLATSISFYLFIPYLSRYAHEFNRFVFHWTRTDLVSLMFCIVLIGMFFFLPFIILYVWGNKITKKVFNILFFATLGIALVANVLQLLKSKMNISFSSPWIHWIIWLYSGYFLWILLGIFLIYAIFKNTGKIKAICVALCFIASPILPIFTLNALRFTSITSNSGSLPAVLSEIRNYDEEDKRNVYIFIFDEWSYQRSFNNQKLITEFKNLKLFKESALVFHQAFSPSPNTLTSMPAFLFQTNLEFIAKRGVMGFKSEGFHPINQKENIFYHARGLGFYTCIIGSYTPYGDLLGESIDFSKSISVAKRLGDSFLGVSKYHIITTLLLLPEPFIPYERRLITDYFFNRFQINRINATHELFKTIVKNQTSSTFGVFHYMIPHFPYIFNREGHKKLFHIYKLNSSNYYDNLAYLDRKIGEIISVLKKVNKFENSLIIMTSDHSWRHDPNYDKDNSLLEKCHVPLFIKMPYQNFSIEINSKFTTSKLGTIINKYLDGEFDPAKTRSIFCDENLFIPPLPN